VAGDTIKGMPVNLWLRAFSFLVVVIVIVIEVILAKRCRA